MVSPSSGAGRRSAWASRPSTVTITSTESPGARPSTCTEPRSARPLSAAAGRTSRLTPRLSPGGASVESATTLTPRRTAAAATATGSATRRSVTRTISRAPASAAVPTAGARTDSWPAGVRSASESGCAESPATVRAPPVTSRRAPSRARACARAAAAVQAGSPVASSAAMEALASRMTKRSERPRPPAAGTFGFHRTARTPARASRRAARRSALPRTANSRR